MAPALARRHHSTASATRRSRSMKCLKKVGVVEEEEVMGWGWLKIFELVELIDEWIDGSIWRRLRWRRDAAVLRRRRREAGP